MVKQVSKRPAAKKPVAKRTTATKAKSPRATATRVPKSTKVDYYPNRMTVAVSALAGTILVLVAVIAVLGARG